jgi:predicted deacylase
VAGVFDAALVLLAVILGGGRAQAVDAGARAVAEPVGVHATLTAAAVDSAQAATKPPTGVRAVSTSPASGDPVPRVPMANRSGVASTAAMPPAAASNGFGAADPVPPPDWGALAMLGDRVFPGQKRELVFLSSESFQAASVESPVVVIRGLQPGPTLCLTAGVHGDELNGVEIVRRILEETKPAELRGTIVGVPIVNIQGFERSSRYLPDRRDLNRHFPGRPDGSSASRIAYAFFESVVRNCDALVDLHTGSFHRANLPQVRGDLRNKHVLDLARAFGTEVAVHNVGRLGTLRRAATDAEIPAIIYEAGEPMRFQRTEIERGAAGIRNLLGRLGLTEPVRAAAEKQWIYYQSHWIRVDHGGILLSEVRLGDWVRENEALATVTDPMGRERSAVVATRRGRVLGMTLAPVVRPGVAVFNIGLEAGDPSGAEADENAIPEYVDLEDERPE